MKDSYKYNLNLHGDPLEKRYAVFIQKHFKTYEKVWSIYIGNKGNSTIADIPGFPKEFEPKRQSFSENTYTILQSVISIYRLLNSNSFNDPLELDIENVLDVHDKLILFFTHLGRIRDCSIAANNMLIEKSNFDIENFLKEFYEKRHPVVHGKMIPLQFGPDGKILIPKLYITADPLYSWSHKENNWGDVKNIHSGTIATSLSEIFWQLLAKLNEIFGQYYSSIESTLKSKKLRLKFTYEVFVDLPPSGSTFVNDQHTSIYGINFK